MFVFRSSRKSAKLRSYVEAVVYIISHCIDFECNYFPLHTHILRGELCMQSKMTSAVAASFTSFGDIKPSQQFMEGSSPGFGPSSLSSSAGIAGEKQELLALLEDIPQMHQSIHPSYTLIPWAYKLYLAVDHSEPSETAKAYGVLSNNSDSAATGSKEEEQGCPHLDDTALPPSLSLAERRAIYQMVHSVLACE